MSRPKGGAATRICEDVSHTPRPSFAAGPALHPEGASGPVVARFVLVIVLIRRHGSRSGGFGRLGLRDAFLVGLAMDFVSRRVRVVLSGDARGLATARGVATTRRRGSSSQGVALAHAGRSLDVDSAAGLEYARRVD